MMFLDLAGDNRVIIPKDESIFLCLILNNTEFGIHIILHFIIITIQMIGSNIQQNSYISLEIIHIIQLETA